MVEDPDSRARTYRALGHATTVGMVFVAASLAGYFLGNYLDSRYGTSPYLMALFVLLGAVGGFIEVVRIAQKLSKDV